MTKGVAVALLPLFLITGCTFGRSTNTLSFNRRQTPIRKNRPGRIPSLIWLGVTCLRILCYRLSFVKHWTRTTTYNWPWRRSSNSAPCSECFLSILEEEIPYVKSQRFTR